VSVVAVASSRKIKNGFIINNISTYPNLNKKETGDWVLGE